MEIVALTILVVFCFIGFGAIFFTTFGTLIILLGALLYALLTGFSVISFKVFLVLFTLYLVGEVMEYFFIIVGAKSFGASNAAVVGAIIGGIIGAILGFGFFGVGVILGTFLGIFLGAFLVEWTVQKDLVKSLKASAGSVLGRLGSIAAKVIIACIMFFIMTYSVIQAS